MQYSTQSYVEANMGPHFPMVRGSIYTHRVLGALVLWVL